MKIKSKKPCLLVIAGVEIKPSISEISNEDFEIVKDHQDFQNLVADGFIEIDLNADSKSVSDDVDVALEKQDIRTLRSKADALGLEYDKDIKKSDLVNLLKNVM